ncbi:hypothetical protein NQ317_018983 [Molorchus minor]|uniref:Alanine--glyoxylate aminotransferase 2, mitochondrial n=1 Tax=Molorchus minor TaxID=1323400 RepID=A0ABQ9JC25_9CUCU|nr:hypothetical protein NQ317_018983 [Molorchus minor]
MFQYINFRKITDAVFEQMQTLGHVSNVYFHSKIHEYSKRLAETLPGNLKSIYLVNSGSEANDLALLMARAYTGRFEVASLRNGYHGMTYQTMGMVSNNCYKYPVPSAAGFVKTMNPNVYRGLWGGNKCRDSPVQTDRTCSCNEECEAGLRYVEQFEEELINNVPKNNIAAFWAESTTGRWRNHTVQTGFGRTGDHFWGFEMHGIIPDIVTMAKGIGNGFPLAAVATTPEIAQALTKASHFNTFGGNPIGCTVGIAVLDIIEEENLQENCIQVGTYLLLELAKLKSKYTIFGDVRGKGLMIGVELVSNSETREPVSPQIFMKFWEYCRDRGVIIGKGGLNGNVRCFHNEYNYLHLHLMYSATKHLSQPFLRQRTQPKAAAGVFEEYDIDTDKFQTKFANSENYNVLEDVLRIKPPMCITKEDADFTVEVLEEAAKYVG